MRVHGFDLGKRGFRPVELPVCVIGREYGSGKLDTSKANLMSRDALRENACFMPFRATGTGTERAERVEQTAGFSGVFRLKNSKWTTPRIVPLRENNPKGWMGQTFNLVP